MRPKSLALVLVLALVPALLALACDADEEDGGDTDTVLGDTAAGDATADTADTTSGTDTALADTDASGDDVGEVSSGLEASRALSELSETETTTLCESMAAARQAVLDDVGAEALCQFFAVANAQQFVTESGLEEGRSACRNFLAQCLADPPAVTCENHAADDLVDWAACAITVGEVEVCRSADNAHTLAEIEAVRDAAVTCDTLDESTVVFLPDDAVDAACPAIYACDA